MSNLTDIARLLTEQNALLRELVGEVRRLRDEPRPTNVVDEVGGSARYGVDPATGRVGWVERGAASERPPAYDRLAWDIAFAVEIGDGVAWDAVRSAYPELAPLIPVLARGASRPSEELKPALPRVNGTPRP